MLSVRAHRQYGTYRPYNLQSLRASSNSLLVASWLLDAVCACTQTVWDVPIFAEFPGKKTTIFFSFVLTLDWPKPSPPQKKNWLVVSHTIFLTATWGDHQNWLIFFKWVETTNKTKQRQSINPIAGTVRINIPTTDAFEDFQGSSHHWFRQFCPQVFNICYIVTYTYLTNG